MLNSSSFHTNLNFRLFPGRPSPGLPPGTRVVDLFCFCFCFFPHFQCYSVTSIIQVLRPCSYRGLCNGTRRAVHGKLPYNTLFPCFFLLCSLECVMWASIRYKLCILGELNRETQSVSQSVKFKMCRGEVGILRRETPCCGSERSGLLSGGRQWRDRQGFL